MPSAYDEVMGSIQANHAYLSTLNEEPQRSPTAVLMYVHWLEIQKRLVESAPGDDTDKDLVLHNAADNEGFRALLARGFPQDAQRLSAHLTPDGIEDLPQNEHDVVVDRYGKWIQYVLGRCEMVATEVSLGLQLRQEDRDLLLREVAAARATIEQARKIRLDYRKARSAKKDLKADVMKYLHMAPPRIGKVPTARLVKKLTKKATALETEIRAAGTKSVRGRALRRELAQVRAWIADLPLKQTEKGTAKEKDKAFVDIAKQATKLMSDSVKEEHGEFSKALKHVGEHVQQEQERLGAEIEQFRSEVEELHPQMVSCQLKIDEYESALERNAKRKRPSNTRKTRYEKAIEEEKKALDELRERERILIERIESSALMLTTITTALRDGIEGEEDLERRRVAMKEELGRLEKIPALQTAVNVYCSFYEVSYPLLLRFGALVAEKSSGFDLETPLVGPGGTTMSGRQKMAVFARLLRKMGLPKGILKCEAWDAGRMVLSLKLGLSYGPDVGAGFTAKVGLAFVYEAELKQRDDRRFEASGTLKVVASAEATATIEIPWFTDKMALFSAIASVDLFASKTTHIFTDYFHWAAWVCQRWAHLAAKARAFDEVYQESRYETPTPNDLTQIQTIAQQTLTSSPALVEVLSDIAWFLEEDIQRVDEFSIGNVDIQASALDEMAGFRVGGGKPFNVDIYRYKRDPQTRDIVVDPGSGLPIEMKKRIEKGRFYFQVKLAGIDFDFIVTHNEERHDLQMLKLRLWIRASETLGWVLTNVGQVNQWVHDVHELVKSPLYDALDASEELEESAEELINDLIATIMGPLGGGGGAVDTNFIEGFRSAIEAFQAPLAMLLKPLKFTFEWGFIRCGLRDGTKSWRLAYVRNFAFPKSDGKNRREFPIPTGFPGLNIDFGFNYNLYRTFKEKLVAGTLRYVKLLYSGIRPRREMAPGGKKHHYRTTIPRFVFNLLGVPPILARRMAKFEATSGRPKECARAGLWARLTRPPPRPVSGAVKPLPTLEGGLFGLFASIAGASTKVQTKAKSEKDAWWCRQELDDDAAIGITSAGALKSACDAMLTSLPPDPGGALAGTKEWKKHAKGLFTNPHKGIGGDKAKARTWRRDPAAQTAYDACLTALETYLEDACLKAEELEDQGWTEVPASKGMEAITKLGKKFQIERYEDYLGWLDSVESLQARTGASRKQVEQALKKRSFDEALVKLEKTMRKRKPKTTTT